MPERSCRPAVTCCLASVVLFLAGCTGGPATTAQPDEPRPVPTPHKAPGDSVEVAPRWVTDPPERSGDRVFFPGWVEGYYSDPHNGFEDAERRALADVAKSIAVHVSSEIVIIDEATSTGFERQEVSSEVRTWASEYVEKLPGRKEYYDKKTRRYHVLVAVPKAIVEPTAANLVRFIKKNHAMYVSKGEDRKALDSLKTLVRLDPSPRNKALLFNYLRQTERWTEAMEIGEVLKVELEPGSKERAKLIRLLPLVRKGSKTEPEMLAAKRKKRLARLRVGVAAFVGRDAYPELEKKIVATLGKDGVKVSPVSTDLASLTVRGMTESVDQVRGFVGGAAPGEDITHVLVGQVEVLWLMRKKVKGGAVDYYVAFISGAFIDLEDGKVIESFIRDVVGTKGGVRTGADLEARTRKCRRSLARNATASVAGKMPRLVKEYLERR